MLTASRSVFPPNEIRLSHKSRRKLVERAGVNLVIIIYNVLRITVFYALSQWTDGNGPPKL